MWCRGVGLLMTLILSLLATPLVTDAQQATKVHRIGRLVALHMGVAKAPL